MELLNQLAIVLGQLNLLIVAVIIFGAALILIILVKERLLEALCCIGFLVGLFSLLFGGARDLGAAFLMFACVIALAINRIALAIGRGSQK